MAAILPANPRCQAQGTPPAVQQPLPEAPQPSIPNPIGRNSPDPCPVKSDQRSASNATSAGNQAAAGQSLQPGPQAAAQPASPDCPPHQNWYVRFTNGPQVKPLTPREKGWLALRNSVDPFNAITILADAGIAIGSDSHSAYGPGMPGFARNVGVSYTQDITNEFFNTFLISSLVHQDPHYHRMPGASIPKRLGHAVLQVVWTQGDNGRPMPNYGNLFSAPIDDELSNLYVPGRRTNLPSAAQRVAIGLATAPIDNFVSEFLPDLARHIHIQVVVIQRIIDQVAKTGASE